MGEVGWEGSAFANVITGAFTGSPATAGSPSMTGGSSRYRSATLDASIANELYSGAKLQIPALQTLVCIKL